MISDHIANIRYQLNGCVDQADKVYEKLVGLDFETIQLNLKDLSEQMNVAQAELRDLSGLIQEHLNREDDDDPDTL